MTRIATKKQREADAARRAIMALMGGRPAYGASKETCGEWWTMVNRLGEVREREGAQAVVTVVEALKRAHPRIAEMMAGAETGGARIVPISAEELRAKQFAPPKWAVRGSVPAGLTILAGAPKMGKSWLCFDLAIAVARGGSVLGGVEVEQGSVLYLALEDNERRLRQRLDKLLEGGPTPPGLDFLCMDHGVPRLDEGGKEQIAWWLDEHPDARMVIVDTLVKFKARPRLGSGVYDQDNDSVQPLLQLASQRGVPLVVVHHTRKAGASDALEQINGSFGLSGGVDNVLVLKRERLRADAVLAVIGRDIEDKELALSWDAASARWSIAGDAAAVRLSQGQEAILVVLRQAGRAMTARGVWTLMEPDDPELTYNAVTLRMHRMARDGLLAAADGKYSIPLAPQ